MKNDFRARNHPAYWAFIVHRASGLLLAVFLPFHFWALGQALQGAAALDGFLHWTQQPLVKLAEIGLVLLLAAHMAGGVRLADARVPGVARLAEEPARRRRRREPGGGPGIRAECGLILR